MWCSDILSHQKGGALREEKFLNEMLKSIINITYGKNMCLTWFSLSFHLKWQNVIKKPKSLVSPRYKGDVLWHKISSLKKFILNWGCWLKSMVHASPDKFDRKCRDAAVRTGQWACLGTKKLCDLPYWKEGPSGRLVRVDKGRTRESWAILILSSSCLPRRQS